MTATILNTPPDILSDPELSQNALVILEKRYLRKDRDGNITETPKELFWRVASAVALADKNYGASDDDIFSLALDFYNLMASLKFLPNSPTLMNAGTPLGQLSACFVLPVEDSIEGIFDAVKNAALIHKSGGGTGFSFSRLRPIDSMVGSTGGVSSGPVSFMKVFNAATEQIKQGSRRRGANMGILRIDHPDIIDFIKAKEVEGELSNFNLSVAITDKFMDALDNDRTYDLINPHDGKVAAKLPAKEVWDLLVDRAWLSGDPGIVFLDSINRDNPTPELGEIEATNPCGEQPLLPYEACNLGSINLAKFYKNGAIDWDGLEDTINLAVRFLDDVIDANHYPLPEIAENVRKTRKIGLGIMGFADLLFMLGIPYNSDKGLKKAKRIMGFIENTGHNKSRELAEIRGKYQACSDDYIAPPRNATVTTIAPTGSLSIIANCSGGIEPVFALAFTKNVLGGEKLLETNQLLLDKLHELGKDTQEILSQIAERGTIQDIDELPEDLRKVFVTAMDITPEWHLKMQAAFQEYTDNAVSKTINLPNSATREDIDFIYREAYRLGCKGTTVYRDGCKSIQVFATGERQKQMNGEDKPQETRQAKRERPAVVNGFTEKVQTGLGTMYLTVNEVDCKPFEVFATIGKSGKSITAKTEAIGRLISLALRSGISVKEIINQLKGICGDHPAFRKNGMFLSIPDAIAWVLGKHYLDGKEAERMDELAENSCPECGASLILQEGCCLCPKCGFSRCG